MFTAAEYVDMLLVYGECGHDANAARILYARRFPNRQCPRPNVFLRLVNRARDTGILLPQRRGVAGAPRGVRNPQNEELILGAFREDPTASIRQISEMYQMSRSTVHRILRGERQHAFHYTRVQHLRPQDYPARVEFCRWLLQKNTENPNFITTVLFTDEATFSREGVFNTRNWHVWAEENPHASRPRSYQRRFKTNLWAGILGDQLVGPFELPVTLAGDNYQQFLQQDLTDLLDDVPLAIRMNHWFQHDGASAHFVRRARRYLNRVYPDSWIGRGGQESASTIA